LQAGGAEAAPSPFSIGCDPMIELIITVCLISAPAACHEERHGVVGESLLACITQGQLYAARWIDEHPTYRIVRWRCEPSAARQSPV